MYVMRLIREAVDVIAEFDESDQRVGALILPKRKTSFLWNHRPSYVKRLPLPGPVQLWRLLT